MPGNREPAPEAWWARPVPTGATGSAPPYAEHPAATWNRGATGSGRTITPASRTRSGPPRYPGRYPGRHPFLGDQRGLTTAGAAVVVLILSSLGAAVDITTGTGLRTVFTITFVIAATLVSTAVRTEDLLASVVLIPLAFAVVAGIAGLIEGSGFGTLTKLVEAAAIVMINAAPALMLATAIAAAIAGARGYAHRKRRRPVRPARPPQPLAGRARP